MRNMELNYEKEKKNEPSKNIENIFKENAFNNNTQHDFEFKKERFFLP